jgi:hypothetical protein
MTDEPRAADDDLTEEELAEQDGEPLPERAAMAIVDPNLGTLPPVPFDPTNV